MVFRHDPEGARLPIKIDSTSNGEFVPVPLDAAARAANRAAFDRVGEDARRLGLARRAFLVTGCGAASTLLAFNAANAAAGRTGGYFALAHEAAYEPEAADAALNGDDFIFDVQGHFVNPEGKWLELRPEGSQPLSGFPNADCPEGEGPGERSYLRCFGSDQFIHDVFMDSDTDMMVLSFVPSTREGEPLTIEEAAATREIVERMEGSHRLMLHGRVNPNQAGDVEDMERRAEFGIAAWKTYTQWGPDGEGFYLTDDDTGAVMIEKARALGTPLIAVHKGLPFGEQSYEHSTCRDVGPAAARWPDTKFLIYHSGYVTGKKEGPYDPDRTDGVDSLITSARENGNPDNIYAELGSTWRFVMRDPEEAAHLMGKLLKYLGPDQVLWGTDSIWYGSPQDQIQAFRSFQISEEFRERYGYPEITPEIRAKIFGLNALKAYGLDEGEIKKGLRRDRVQQARAAYRQAPDPHFRTFGPKSRRQFLNFQRWNGEGP